jgi:hypothetical protein
MFEFSFDAVTVKAVVTLLILAAAALLVLSAGVERTVFGDHQPALGFRQQYSSRGSLYPRCDRSVAAYGGEPESRP